ncbi:MAG: hypothetical protein PF569_00205 [Candidatus Woesearchaeota archaeon]|jgi:hypothetical protein|nr:hypothetical protein [Candidatus Woesearchaeota archaeon]
MLEQLLQKAYRQFFEAVIKDLKVECLTTGGRKLAIPKLNDTQLAIIEALIKNEPVTISSKRGIGTSTAIYLFLAANLVCGKYKRVALVHNCGAADHHAMGKLKDISRQIIENPTSRSISNDGIEIETVSLDRIEYSRGQYDLIIFDNIDNCDKPHFENKDYGISIYTSEKEGYKDRIENLTKTLSKDLTRIESHLKELNFLKEQLNVGQ